MSFYLIPLIFLAFLSILEHANKLTLLINNKYIYFSIALFFILFIGLRYNIGCDWWVYKSLFKRYSSINIFELIKDAFFLKYRLQEIGHIFITLISKNIYVLNLIYSTIFIIPLFYVCSTIRRKYLSLVVSYPYYIIVVGMGPIRQAACISLLMLSILFISKKKYIVHFFLTIFTLLIHQFSFIFNGITVGAFFPEFLKNKLSKKSLFLILILISIFAYSLPSLLSKTYSYFTFYGQLTKDGNQIIPPAKSAIFIWAIHFLPAFIFLKNISQFKFNNNLKKILTTLSIFEIILLPFIFLNSVVSYRLLLYFFPSSIYITSYLPDLRISRIKSKYILISIILMAFITEIIWIQFAYHSYCWVPYKNILFN